MGNPEGLPIPKAMAAQGKVAVRVDFHQMELGLIERACGPNDRFPDDLPYLIREATLEWAKERLRKKGFKVDG